jgi:tetratricopeptide (TPR) repeat protein
VFRSDYRMAALYTLALAAERSGAPEQARNLFRAAIVAIPAMAAGRSGKRVRSLIHAHLVFAHADLGDLQSAHQALQQCHRELGAPEDGALRSLLMMDDSGFGPIGLNTLLTEVEGKRDPRPFATLAGAYLASRMGNPRAAYDLLTADQVRLAYGLAENERALLTQTIEESGHALSAQGPMRAPGTS